MNKSPKDINGKSVSIGTKVKILSVSEYLLTKLPQVEVDNLKTMVGETFEVYEIDEWGGVWVQKEFEGESENQVSSHSLKLDPDEMKIIE